MTPEDFGFSRREFLVRQIDITENRIVVEMVNIQMVEARIRLHQDDVKKLRRELVILDIGRKEEEG